jgi:hypothetical protein
MTSEEISIEGYESLESMVEAGWATGAGIDLTGVTYGRPHWEGTAPKAPFAYYRFLAGLVRHTGATRILEIGTHFGGSTLAMARGFLPGAAAHLLTIDVEFENIEPLLREPRIQRFQGEALHPDVITAITKAFHHLPVDLLYIDADHRFFPTLAMVSIYSQLLKPRLIVLDDINLYDDMRAMWQLLERCHPGEALDVTKLVPEMTLNMPTATQGFGIIRLR